MGFIKSVAKAVSDVVDVELQILPSLIGGLLTGGVGGLLLSGALSGAQVVLGQINPREFERTGFTVKQLRALNFLRFREGLPLVDAFGVELTGFRVILAREDIDRARKAASLRDRRVGIGSPLPDVDPFFLQDNPFLNGRASNLARPPTGGGVVIDVTPTGGALRSRSAPPSQRGTVLPAVPPLSEAPMGFFETLGDKIVAAAPDIIQGFATGGFSGGFAAAGLAAVGGAPAGFGGVPPRLRRGGAPWRSTSHSALCRSMNAANRRTRSDRISTIRDTFV